MQAAAIRLPWPLPALLAWAAAWASASAVGAVGAGAGWALSSGAAIGCALASLSTGLRRRAIAALGFPVSAALLGGLGSSFNAWAWLALLLPLVLLYPLGAWRDAPFFPTPTSALDGLDAIVAPAPRRVLDAGCGLGHGLAALARLWPAAQLAGIERSAPMAWLAARRVPAAHVMHGDMWRKPWAGHDLVYLFQRPESMARAWAKAVAEMDPGSWFASLEFAVPGVAPHARLDAGAGRPLYVYRVPAARASAARGSTGRSIGRAAGR
jgi:SAM-dependent methyltransferase